MKFLMAKLAWELKLGNIPKQLSDQSSFRWNSRWIRDNIRKKIPPKTLKMKGFCSKCQLSIIQCSIQQSMVLFGQTLFCQSIRWLENRKRLNSVVCHSGGHTFVIDNYKTDPCKELEKTLLICLVCLLACSMNCSWYVWSAAGRKAGGLFPISCLHVGRPETKDTQSSRAACARKPQRRYFVPVTNLDFIYSIGIQNAPNGILVVL